ncbi:PTS system mannose-specific EIIBCA component [Pantoea ananatis]|uniref:PTS system mannose-specific EIIBCA component n=1 Tax=Pantoea ananas TaxID=553 RepID=A0AAJ1D2Q0_PANAN|nr:fructose PTS transporter subunit IIA [Pantoea ananatis]MCW0346132.1 PTS system mannose-specific EIIBCA component [Pantoea ananatis]
MLIDHESIFLNKAFTSKDEVFDFIASHAVAQGWAVSADDIKTDLWQREHEYSTGFESQIAMPHAKTDNVIKAGVIFIRLNDAIEWQSLDGEPIKIIFALLVPKSGASLLHLKIINALASQIVDDDFRRALFTLEKRDALFQFMVQRIQFKEEA